MCVPLRDALTKMKDVYVKNPQMGDPSSVDPRLAEIGHHIDKLQAELQKFEVRIWLYIPMYNPRTNKTTCVLCLCVCVCVYILQGWLAEVEGRMPVRSEMTQRQSVVYETQNNTTTANNSCAQDRERYTHTLACVFQSLQL